MLTKIIIERLPYLELPTLKGEINLDIIQELLATVHTNAEIIQPNLRRGQHTPIYQFKNNNIYAMLSLMPWSNMELPNYPLHRWNYTTKEKADNILKYEHNIDDHRNENQKFTIMKNQIISYINDKYIE